MIRVLVADDHVTTRHELVALLGAFPGIEVAGQTTIRSAAVAESARLRPDVVFVAADTPAADAIDTIRQITGDEAHPGVIVCSGKDSNRILFGALDAQASGFLLRSAGSEELLATIHTVADGGYAVSPARMRRVLAEFVRRRSAAETGATLNRRERDVLQALTEGKANREIAADLGMGPGAVKHIVSTLLARRNLRTRTELAVWALRNDVVAYRSSPSTR